MRADLPSPSPAAALAVVAPAAPPAWLAPIELLALAGARVRHAVGATSPERFEVRALDARSRDDVLRRLDAHAELAGQFHVLSRDPWRFMASPCGEAVAAFQERAFTLVAWRDPIGPAGARGAALARLRAYGRAVGKQVVVLAASEALARAASRDGWGSVWVGSEPFFDLARWSLRGKAGEKLRLACNHARRAGCSARELFPLASPADAAAIADVESAWKAARPERRNASFLRTEPMENARFRRYFGVESAAPARLQSFVVCSPVGARGWYLQDLVRRPDAPRGAGELVSVAAMERLRDDGFASATMGVVPMYDPAARHAPDAGSVVVRACLGRFDRLFRFSGLAQFRSKWAAHRWEPVSVLHWPRLISPTAALDLAAVLSPRAPRR